MPGQIDEVNQRLVNVLRQMVSSLNHLSKALHLVISIDQRADDQMTSVLTSLDILRLTADDIVAHRLNSVEAVVVQLQPVLQWITRTMKNIINNVVVDFRRRSELKSDTNKSTKALFKSTVRGNLDTQTTPTPTSQSESASIMATSDVNEQVNQQNLNESIQTASCQAIFRLHKQTVQMYRTVHSMIGQLQTTNLVSRKAAILRMTGHVVHRHVLQSHSLARAIADMFPHCTGHYYALTELPSDELPDVSVNSKVDMVNIVDTGKEKLVSSSPSVGLTGEFASAQLHYTTHSPDDRVSLDTATAAFLLNNRNDVKHPKTVKSTAGKADNFVQKYSSEPQKLFSMKPKTDVSTDEVTTARRPDAITDEIQQRQSSSSPMATFGPRHQDTTTALDESRTMSTLSSDATKQPAHQLVKMKDRIVEVQQIGRQLVKVSKIMSEIGQTIYWNVMQVSADGKSQSNRMYGIQTTGDNANTVEDIWIKYMNGLVQTAKTPADKNQVQTAFTFLISSLID